MLLTHSRCPSCGEDMGIDWRDPRNWWRLPLSVASGLVLYPVGNLLCRCRACGQRMRLPAGDVGNRGPRIELVPAADADCEFAYRVKVAAEEELITSIFGWDEAKQRAFHAEAWAQHRPDVILYNGERIGTITIGEEHAAITVKQFFILPAYQNRGIGSCLLRRVLARADREGKLVRLAYLTGNRAESLYRRHGFVITGEAGHFTRMERRPRAPRT